MYISGVTLTNIRGFKNLGFSFDRGRGRYAGWTVFTGDNGSGKSTLLRAIAVALTGKDVALSLEPSFNGWIHANEHSGSISLDVVRTDEDDRLAESGKQPLSPIRALLTLKNGGALTTIESGKPSGMLKQYRTPQRTIWAPGHAGWFSCGYGPFRRVFGASPEATRQMVSPATERFVTMFQEAASLAEVDQWLRSLHHKQLEQREQEKLLLETLLEILRDDLIPNQMSVDRVDSDGLWLKDRNGLRLSWREMSDGYRAALALLADILRHMVNTYGGQDLIRRDGHGGMFINRSGVVLIDEIDAHLHPAWQRRIGFWLKSHFPRIQFLVTTHSPLICQAADPNGIFVLPEPGSEEEPRAMTEEEYRVVVNAKPDGILRSSAFGLQNTRSEQAVEKRKEFARLQAKKRGKARLTAVESERLGQLRLDVSAADSSEER